MPPTPHSSENACATVLVLLSVRRLHFAHIQGCRSRAKRRPAAGAGAGVPAAGGGGGAGVGEELYLRKLRGRSQLPRGLLGVLRAVRLASHFFCGESFVGR